MFNANIFRALTGFSPMLAAFICSPTLIRIREGANETTLLQKYVAEDFYPCHKNSIL
jgi:hypothetical protein